MANLAHDPLAQLMQQAGIAVTRQNYIDAAWGVDPPDPWMPEDELDLPEELRPLRRR
jgi:hypothetical protein